jgi:hypothetical protein
MPPSAASASASAAVRVSCQVIDRATGQPVRRSHSTTVSRSFAIPIAATSAAVAPAAASAAWMHSCVRCQTSAMSSSTQPGRG